jgi:Cation transporter/ATPase, N-terminus
MASTDTTADQTTEGLSSAETEQWPAKYGRNEVAEEQESVLKKMAKHFWAPVPWMLEAAVVFQLVVGEYIEDTLIAAATPVQRRARDVSGRPGQRGAVLRERGHMWNSRPSLVLMLFSLADIVIVAAIAIFGLVSPALPTSLVLILLAATCVFAVLLDQVKVAVFRLLPVD